MYENIGMIENVSSPKSNQFLSTDLFVFSCFVKPKSVQMTWEIFNVWAIDISVELYASVSNTTAVDARLEFKGNHVDMPNDKLCLQSESNLISFRLCKNEANAHAQMSWGMCNVCIFIDL